MEKTLAHAGFTPELRHRLAIHASERGYLLENLKNHVASDPRIAAAWLYGSIARGDNDELSDIDVRIVVRGAHLNDVLAERYDFVAAIGKPVLVQEAPQNRPPGGAYNMVWYAGTHGPHAVDWTWSSSESTLIPTEAALIDNRANLEHSGEPMEFAYQPIPERDRAEEVRQTLHGFWAMLLIVAKYAARNPFEERMALLQWTVPQLREAERFAGRLPGLDFGELPSHSQPSEKMLVLRSLATEASMLSADLAHRGVVAPEIFVPHAHRFLDLVEAIMNASKRAPGEAPIGDSHA